jgi:hypothetical protein
MSDPDDLEMDGPLRPEAEARVNQLTAADLQRIDECLLSHMSHRWQKVARIVSLSMMALQHDFPDLPDGIFGLRIKHLAESGAIESAGNLGRMRYSEVRIPDPQE